MVPQSTTKTNPKQAEERMRTICLNQTNKHPRVHKSPRTLENPLRPVPMATPWRQHNKQVYNKAVQTFWAFTVETNSPRIQRTKAPATRTSTKRYQKGQKSVKCTNNLRIRLNIRNSTDGT